MKSNNKNNDKNLLKVNDNFELLAKPAPKVEAAVAPKAPFSEPVAADAAKTVSTPHVKPAQIVGPAVLERESLIPAILTATVNATIANKNQYQQEQQDKDVEVDLSASTLLQKSQFHDIVAVIKANNKKKKNLFQQLFNNEPQVISFGEVARFVVICGNACFVYGHDWDVKPLYILDLTSYVATRTTNQSISIISPTGRPTILLRPLKRGDATFQFTFKDRAAPKIFMDLVQQQAKPVSATVLSTSSSLSSVGKTMDV